MPSSNALSPISDRVDGLADSLTSGERGAVSRFLSATWPVVDVLTAVALPRHLRESAARQSCRKFFHALIARPGLRPALAVVYECTAQAIEEVGRTSDFGSSTVGFPAGRALTVRERDILALRTISALHIDDVSVALASTAHRIRIEQHRAITALRAANRENIIVPQ
ncbi:hypothetical protein [Rhodococcus sp. 66b]|uniref:hypothetical protein n=1 Tax=Rhodococcus sp. 66b TaxID=1945511 RepID=UPI0009BAD813|nr:hypothetical protein [Rhodococcus sp. 66b]OQM77992.1 hypothetical protein B0E55_06037 [Rhodococcus sp. 66b]